MEKLPLQFDFNSKRILTGLIKAHKELAHLYGLCESIPNQIILIQTLSLQEAKDSSEIENIITTHADIYTAIANPEFSGAKPAAKEVIHYAEALMKGFELYKRNNILTLGGIEEIQSLIERNRAGLRKLPGTALINEMTKEIVYEPPLPTEIPELIDNFLLIFNDDSAWEIDPLVKMTVLHYQFESIHPFYDGNGRTGRILNVLYLIHEELLEYPVLYLSRYINQTKTLYYKYLQSVRTLSDTEVWEDYILFMLDGVARTARLTSNVVISLKDKMREYKNIIQSHHPSFYNQDLIDSLFSYPFTRISILQNKLGVSYLTARKYLDLLAADKLLHKVRIGRDNYYVNVGMMDILANVSQDDLKVKS